jgi:DNA-binding NtrC family response regulator
MKTEKRSMRILVVIVTGERGLELIADGFEPVRRSSFPKPFTTDQLQRAPAHSFEQRRVQTNSSELYK